MSEKDELAKANRHEARQNFASKALMLIVAVAAGFGGGYFGGRNTSLNNGSTQAKQQIVSSESELISSIADKVGKSVVSIEASRESLRQSFFGFSEPIVSTGAGTGIILTREGIVITNRHVVPTGTTDVTITLQDGTKLDKVEVIGRTTASDPLDIAFLKIKDDKGKSLNPATLGDSARMRVGDKVITIGNALGQFQNTVTSGIISGFGRSVEASDDSGASTETLQNLFQTDAAINPGNSGGPLVNMNGEVIGINVAMADAQDIGFAIPSNDIKGMVSSVIKKGKLERPYLGVRYVMINDDYAYEYNLPLKRGAYIAPSGDGQASILADSPAERAGLKEKDIITAINDVKIDEKNSLISALGKHSAGDKVTLTVHRDGKELKIEVTLKTAKE